MFKTLTLSITALICAFFIKTGLEQFKSSERTVDVRGLSERTVTSNEATWTITYAALGDELKKTNDAYLKSQKVLVSFLKQLGFTDEEIQKSSANIIDNWANSYGSVRPPNKITIRGSVSVNTSRVNEVVKAVEKTDELIDLGVAFESSNTSFYFTDLNKIKPEMIQEATQNARESASKFAADTESKLGKIKTASQGLFSISDPNVDYQVDKSISKKVRVVTQVTYYLE